MLLLLELGRGIAIRQMTVDPEGAKAGLGAVVGVVFSLLGLLLAFTFSGAASRFDARKQLIVQEVNTLGKAYYVLDLFPEPVQTKLKDSFRRYLDAELQAIKALPDIRAAKQAFARSSALKADMQNQAIAACRNPNTQPIAAYVLLPAINEWIANSTNRIVAVNTHPPFAIYGVLVGLALVSSLIAGYGMAEAKTRSWLHIYCVRGCDHRDNLCHYGPRISAYRIHSDQCYRPVAGRPSKEDGLRACRILWAELSGNWQILI